MVTASLDCGGAETHVCALGEALIRRGHTVALVSRGGRQVASWLAAGGAHYRVPLGRAPWQMIASIISLNRILKKNHFDLIHVHGRLAGCLCAASARRRGIPMVSTVHARFRVGFVRHFCRWGRRSIAVSQDLKQYLCEEYGNPSERVEVIPNGIDLCRFSPSPKQNADACRVVFLSRLDADCSLGARLLCELSFALSEDFPNLEIVIAGGGSCLAEITRLAERENQRRGRRVVRLTGHVSSPEKLFQSADVVLGVSRVALEAMSCGVPVILGGDEGWLGPLNSENLSLAAESNFCGRGCTSMNKERLEESLRAVLCLSPSERQSLGMILRSYVAEHHSLEVMGMRTEEFYRSVLAERDGREKGTLLCGYYGYGNLGDDALLRGAIRRAYRENPRGTVVALTKNGSKDEDRFGIPCVGRTWILGIARILRRTDRLVFGGGTLLQENTSRRSLWYYTALIAWAKRKQIPVELWGNGLGEPRSEWGRARMRRALEACARIGLRDQASLALAKDLIAEPCQSVISYEEDLALNTQPCSSERRNFLLHYYGLDDGAAYAVVAVRGTGGRGYLDAFVNWVTTLSAQGIRLLLVPMYPREDERICRALAARWQGRVVWGLGAEDLVGLMRGSCVVCGMRLHSLVFAYCAQVPFVGFGGDPKIRCFCHERGGVYFTELYGKGDTGEVFDFC